MWEKLKSSPIEHSIYDFHTMCRNSTQNRRFTKEHQKDITSPIIEYYFMMIFWTVVVF